MSILDFAKKDYQHIVRDRAAWSKDLEFVSPSGVSVNIVGHGMTHNTSYGTDGQVVNGKNTHVSIVETDLVDAGYPLYNSKGVISLTNHTVSFLDSVGVMGHYVINQYYPDETLGIIVCILSNKRV